MPPLIIETPFGFGVDLSFWQSLAVMSQSEITLAFFAIIGWVVLWLILFFMAAELWVGYRQGKYTKKWQQILLAVDVPGQFVQSPKAVEQIFAQLSGALSGANVGQKYWEGKKQRTFSFEIISLDGYIQFLIRTESALRDLVEAAVYAQYPEAEITEVEDYMANLPAKYPDSSWDIAGVEFGLVQDQSFPIRSWQEFEQRISVDKSLVFADPMAAMLENLTRIGHGENFMFQIALEPVNSDWKKKGIELVKDLIANSKTVKKETVISKAGGLPLELLKVGSQILAWNFETEEEKREEAPGKLSDLTPGMRQAVELVEEKISKIGFKAKIRALYAARKEVFNPGRCLDGFIGALGQFNHQYSNAITPVRGTTAHYMFKESRINTLKNKFTDHFKNRKLKVWMNPYVLNIEELATLWHFPLPSVKAPLTSRVSSKRSEAPMNLPIQAVEPFPSENLPAPPTPPEELPYA